MFWNHDFKTDQKGDYEIKGDVKWEPGRITIGKDSSIRKTLEGGRVWEVTLDLEFLGLTRDGDESSATLLWHLNNSARYGLVWSQTRTDGKIVGELQFVKAVAKPETTKPDAIVEWQLIKVFDTTHIPGRQVWTIRWNTGLLEVAAEKMMVSSV